MYKILLYKVCVCVYIYIYIYTRIYKTDEEKIKMPVSFQRVSRIRLSFHQ